MEIASQLLSCACQSAAQPICRQLNYIRKRRENEETMQSEWGALRTQKNDICENMNIGRLQHGKRPKEAVTEWLEKVERIEKRVNSLGSGDANHTCLKGFCPNYYSRLKRSKKTMDIHHEVKDLQEKGKLFAQGQDLFLDSLPETSSGLPATTLHDTSAERQKEEILQCIMDPEASRIGVYGMGGVGKTTIMKQIYNELNEKKAFEIIIWVTVSSSFNVKELQNKVAERLQCQLSPCADLMSRAHILHEALRRRRNFVIILDDIWRSVSLQNVGIPEPNRSNGSKVVWTTRFMEVCNSMESEREIKVEGLTDEEAWSLFKDKVGAENVIMSTEIQPIARQVAKECGRLPLALVTVGCALRKADQPQVWRNALQLLRTSRADQIPGMDKEVLGSLKFSYDSLSSDTTRSCFLYCALYPEDDEIYVDELIEHWIAEGLINEKGSIHTDIDKGHAYLKELKDACMIETPMDDYVKMHDLVRDLAINITKENPKQPLFMVKAGLDLTESPEEEEWAESLQRVSLMMNKIKVYRGQPNCPRLSTLLLNNQFSSSPHLKTTFSDTFFKHMHNLRVLNLSHTTISSLPASISNLVNLQALILANSRLICLPSLAKLQKLRHLKLRGLSYLKELPHGLENLVKLRHLDISQGNWEGSPYEAILKMSCLEILYVENINWIFSRSDSGHVVDNSKIGVVISLKNLTRFSADFDDVLTFNRYICQADEFGLLKNFDYFRFTVDLHNVENESMEKVKLPSIANSLDIVGCNFIQLLDYFGSNDLRSLVDCCVKNCDEMVWIVGDGEIVLPSLKVLYLASLHSFKGLCKEKAHEETFKSLTKLLVQDCHKLKYLIPIDLLMNNLQNLQEISVDDCSEMKEIISGESSTDMTTLPKLKALYLQLLPRLTSICQGKLVCDLLGDIKITSCPRLERLPFLISNESNIERKISVSQELWDNLAWEDSTLKERLVSIFNDDEEEDIWVVSPYGIDMGIKRKPLLQIAKFNFNNNSELRPYAPEYL